MRLANLNRFTFGLALLLLPICKTEGALRKIEDIIVYKDDKFYCAFPSIVNNHGKELLVAFRRAPDRRLFGESGVSHTDPNSYLVLVRSRDGGKTWSQKPELIYAHPFGGSQDPCMVQLRDETILCSSYGWALVPPGASTKLRQVSMAGNFAFLGGYVLRSEDAGRTWQGPEYPPPVPEQGILDPFGQPVASYNRGAMCQGRDGRLYWAVAATPEGAAPRTEVHLLISSDRGKHWRWSCRVAGDSKTVFNETSLYETPAGDLVAFIRTENFNDHTVIARSRDHGRSFEPWQDTGFQGHPHHALKLRDKRVLLVYGYRHPPFGVRARVLDPECRNAGSAKEFVIRDDGGTSDLGYPWAALLSKNRVLVVYYFNQGNQSRYIAGTVLEFTKDSDEVEGR